MSSDAYGPQQPQKVTISAGTAFKIGFVGALGATVFSIILSIIVAVITFIILAVLGISAAQLWPR